jgi:hypothetical protein
MEMEMSLGMRFLKRRMMVRSSEWDFLRARFLLFWIDRQVMSSMKFFSS